MTDEISEVPAAISDQLDSMSTSSAAPQDEGTAVLADEDPPSQRAQSSIFRVKFPGSQCAYNLKRVGTIDQKDNVVFIDGKPTALQDEDTALAVYETLLSMWSSGTSDGP